MRVCVCLYFYSIMNLSVVDTSSVWYTDRAIHLFHNRIDSLVDIYQTFDTLWNTIALKSCTFPALLYRRTGQKHGHYVRTNNSNISCGREAWPLGEFSERRVQVPHVTGRVNKLTNPITFFQPFLCTSRGRLQNRILHFINTNSKTPQFFKAMMSLVMQ